MFKILKNTFLVVILGIFISACSTTAKKSKSVGAGDVYTGTDTVKYLATGVADRVFFAIILKANQTRQGQRHPLKF